MRYRAIYEANLLAQKKSAENVAFCRATGMSDETRLEWLSNVQEKLDELYPGQKAKA